MISISANEALLNFNNLIDYTCVPNGMVKIKGDSNNAILISESDWKSIEETLHLLSIPGMRESIVDGLNTPIEQCYEKLDW